MTRIAITLNQTIRDSVSKFDYIFEKILLQEINNSKQYDLTNTNNDEIVENNLNVFDNIGSNLFFEHLDENYKIDKDKRNQLFPLSKSLDFFNVSNTKKFEDDTELYHILYDDHPFEIFGTAPLFHPKNFTQLNSLCASLIKDGSTVTIVSNEKRRGKSASLYFLGSNDFQGNNIKFLYDYSKIWEIYDTIVTADPYILNTKPNNSDKISIKIKTESNIESKSTLTFDTFEDFYTQYTKEN